MRRRFGRGRKRQGENAAEPIDAARWRSVLAERGWLGADSLEPAEIEGVPAHFAALAQGGEAAGGRLLLGMAPERGADAALAVLSWAARRQREGEAPGPLYAVAPDWSSADRRRLALLAPQLALDCVAASELIEAGVARVAPETPELQPFEPELLARSLERADESSLCERAVAGLEGLAAKHGGAVRGVGDRVELIVMARRCAALVAETRELRIEVYEPERASLPLGGGDALATALDRLEGALRKLLNDRRSRSSEGGLRAALAPLLERAAGASSRQNWPFGGTLGEAIDWIGIDRSGNCAVGASRQELDLPALAQILDGAVLAPSACASLARRLGRVARPGAPRLHLAASEFEPAALDAISALGLEIDLYTASTRRGGDWALEPLSRPSLEVGAEHPTPARTRSAPRAATPRPEPDSEPREEPRQESRPEPRRDSRRDSPRPGPRARADSASSAAQAGAASDGGGSEPARFEEVSLFDLDDEGSAPEREDGGGRPRRRRRRRGRRGREGGRSEQGDTGSDDREARGSESRGSESRGSESRARPAPRASDDDDDEADEVDLDRDDDDTLAPLAEDAPDLDEPDVAALQAEEDDDDGDDGEEERESDRARRERELRRRARIAKPPEPPPAPRRRAAFVAHADPVSLLTAVILARDVRMVEGFWVYPQSDLMTFFRSVATDLGEQTPIFLVGFAASPPARDTIQSASLYRGRLDWFDHHDWPPEDLESLRETLGAEHVHVQPGAENSLAAVIGERTRRSRFSDKLMELITGRFTQHDYERWGRWWWHRAGELAATHGDRKADVDPLLTGRPSDLAKAVARTEEPPLPAELAHVSERDFRLVHFGGLSLVVVEAPEPLDLHLCARLARERYDAAISLAMVPGRDLVVLGADDARTRHSLDLGALASHLATKHAWVEALADDDHVARVRVSGLHERDDRLDDLITEIAMGRSIVEG